MRKIFGGRKIIITNICFLLLCEKSSLAGVFFSICYNIREGTEIISLQSNVRKIYAEPNTVPVNLYDFLMPPPPIPVSCNIFLCSFSSNRGSTGIILLQSNVRKNVHIVKTLRVNGYNFF